MSSPLRDEAVAVLCLTISELDACAVNFDGYDDRAAAIMRSVAPCVVALRDQYANGAPKPLHTLAAQEIRELSDLLKKTAEDSHNQNAARDLVHESHRLDFFVTSRDLTIDSEGRFLFDRSVTND